MKVEDGKCGKVRREERGQPRPEVDWCYCCSLPLILQRLLRCSENLCWRHHFPPATQARVELLCRLLQFSTRLLHRLHMRHTGWRLALCCKERVQLSSRPPYLLQRLAGWTHISRVMTLGSALNLKKNGDGAQEGTEQKTVGGRQKRWEEGLQAHAAW